MKGVHDSNQLILVNAQTKHVVRVTSITPAVVLGPKAVATSPTSA